MFSRVIPYFFLTKLSIVQLIFSKKGYLMLSSDQSYIYAAISAILVVHVILAAFIYIAWQDATSDNLKKKKQ